MQKKIIKKDIQGKLGENWLQVFSLQIPFQYTADVKSIFFITFLYSVLDLKSQEGVIVIMTVIHMKWEEIVPPDHSVLQTLVGAQQA